MISLDEAIARLSAENGKLDKQRKIATGFAIGLGIVATAAVAAIGLSAMRSYRERKAAAAGVPMV
ncbi:MAG: hypothetical protein WC763_07390 [Candidatus Paceibacterota bacterium]